MSERSAVWVVNIISWILAILIVVLLFNNVNLRKENYRLKEQLTFNQAKIDSLELGCNRRYIVRTDSTDGMVIYEFKKGEK